MNSHRNARTTPFSRALIVERRLSGESVEVIAASLGISVRTVYKWISRHREGGCAALEDGASAPARPAGAYDNWWVEAAAQLRRDYRMTASEIAERLRLARSTVARWLKRLGLGRLGALTPRAPVIRYQRERPGELIHLDIKKLGRFENRVIASPDSARATAIAVPAGSVSTSPSMTRPGWPMSRSCPTRNAPPRPASWSGRCAGSRRAASSSNAS
ncbi:transposase [Maricaulis maris]|nr:transposase [Maricaulis maris]